MPNKSDPEPCESCGALCAYRRAEDQPCWGQIQVIDEEYDGEDYTWIHVCEGHYECYDEGLSAYKERPETDR